MARFICVLMLSLRCTVHCIISPDDDDLILDTDNYVTECRTNSNDCCRNDIYGSWWARHRPNSPVPLISTLAFSNVPGNPNPHEGVFSCLETRDDPLPADENERIVGPWIMTCIEPEVATVQYGYYHYLQYIDGELTQKRESVSWILCREIPMKVSAIIEISSLDPETQVGGADIRRWGDMVFFITSILPNPDGTRKMIKQIEYHGRSLED